jgi:signal transduction histidine kinase
MDAIFETAAVVSDEVNLNQLLRKLMQIVVTNAGAEHAFLLLNQEKELRLAATNRLNEEIMVYDHPEIINEHMGFSLSIVHYTVNTEEAVVLDNAAKNGKFINDKFVEKKKAKSILCLPIIYRRRLTGILYLGNNQSSAVFNEERLQLLTWIAAQAAISIENAYLYRNLESKVEERTTLLNEVNQSLLKANQSLTESKEMRRQLLANISHDIHSPIATIQGYVDAILEGVAGSPAQQKEFLQVIKRRLNSLSGLVDDLFELARLESGKASITKEIVPLGQLFNQLCSVYEIEMKQAGLKYEWNSPNFEQAEQPLVEVDIQRIEQVMNNLIGNAMNYTESGKISIHLSLENKEKAVISVMDQGSGIPPAELPYVFDRFYTKRNKSKKEGNGLGLAISREIIIAHGGHIWVESEEGKGTNFSFALNVF